MKSFIGPFFVTFFITLFVLLIQFLWKYIDDLVGKGLEWYIIAKLLFYASANLIPLALPLATLLSAIMTYGNLGERFELAAFKSAGISMFRFMRSTILLGMFISLGAFLFSNYVLPTASLKFWSTLIDITKQKPALNIKANEFYDDIEHFSILIGHKNEDNVHIKDITIYEEEVGQMNDNVLIANTGEMLPSADKKNLIMKLYNGKQYEQLKQQAKNKRVKEHMRMHFGEWEKTLDLSGFQMKQTGEDLYRDHYKMMNVQQLQTAIDSLELQAVNKQKGLKKIIAPYFYFEKDSAFQAGTPEEKLQSEFIQTIPANDRKAIITNALTSVRNIANHTKQIEESLKMSNNRIVEHKIEWHRKFTLSIACIVFLFVGAPLGAIIRKGGFGFPVIFSILIFIFFYVINITGERMADQSALTAFSGMWMAIMIIFPFSIFLTIKAKNDAPVFNRDWYIHMIEKVKKVFVRK
ncbi:MAG: LptF/LptG family permease [Chitinophagales bacterium]|nr:LptF/LptG family permease [Chitinophagales bacterium]